MEYRYTSTEERVYPDRGLLVNFDDVVDWPDGPPADGHWVPTDETQAELDRRAAERAAAEQAAAEDEQKKTDEQSGAEQQSADTPPPTDGEQSPTTPASRRGRKTKEQ